MNLSDSLGKLDRTLIYKIAIEIDFPNIHIGLKNSDWPLPFDYEMIENFALGFGMIHSSRIYADWGDYSFEQRDLSQFNTDLIHIEHVDVREKSKRRKDLVDTQMAVNIGMMLCESSDINLVIIVSGDADFIPVIREIKDHGENKVVIIAAKKSMSEHLSKYADHTINYEYIAKLE